jgi:hypothetical protein
MRLAQFDSILLGMAKKYESAGVAAQVDVAGCIRVIRGQRVLLDADLAALFGVSTKVFNQAVRRNIKRFPADFVMQLTESEANSSRSQNVTLNKGRGHNLKYLPLAFTEHGAIMAATILNSPRAIEMSVYVVRAFVRLRAVLSSNAQLAKKLEALEASVDLLDGKTHRQFQEVYQAILMLMGRTGSEQ